LFKDFSLNIYIGFIWLFSVLSFLELIQIPLLLLLLLLVVTYFITLMFRVHLFSNLLVYLIILAPIFGSINFFNTNLLFSDIFLIFAIFILLQKKIYPYNSSFFYFVLFLIICHVIIHFLIGDLINIKPLISILEIFAVYYTVKETIKVKKNNTIFYSIIFSTTIGVILMFLAFYKGVNLNNFQGDSKSLISDALELDLSNYRMSFFYTNFPLIISSSVFILLFLISRFNKIIIKTLLIFFILLICLSLVTSGNKTLMITTLIVFIVSNFLFVGNGIYRKKNILYLLIFIPILNIFIFSFFLNEFNSELFTQRMLSSDSFEDRIGVYRNVLNIYGNNISRIFFGYGSDFLTGAGDPIPAKKFKINYYTKNEQGAVDSGIITFIIEFGVLYFILFACIIFKRIKFLFLNFNSYNILFLQIFSIFIISSFTQLVGLSKIFWFFVLIFALAKSRYTDTHFIENKSATTTSI